MRCYNTLDILKYDSDRKFDLFKSINVDVFKKDIYDSLINLNRIAVKKTKQYDYKYEIVSQKELPFYVEDVLNILNTGKYYQVFIKKEFENTFGELRTSDLDLDLGAELLKYTNVALFYFNQLSLKNYLTFLYLLVKIDNLYKCFCPNITIDEYSEHSITNSTSSGIDLYTFEGYYNSCFKCLLSLNDFKINFEKVVDIFNSICSHKFKGTLFIEHWRSTKSFRMSEFSNKDIEVGRYCGAFGRYGYGSGRLANTDSDNFNSVILPDFYSKSEVYSILLNSNIFNLCKGIKNIEYNEECNNLIEIGKKTCKECKLYIDSPIVCPYTFITILYMLLKENVIYEVLENRKRTGFYIL